MASLKNFTKSLGRSAVGWARLAAPKIATMILTNSNVVGQEALHAVFFAMFAEEVSFWAEAVLSGIASWTLG